jgi:ADP-ribosylation factor-like protein 5B
MGFLFSKVLELFSRSSNNFKIAILGLQNAGKTTILYRLSLGQLVTTQPTIGSNVEEISHNNVKMQAWDLGGQESMRSVWDAYFPNTDGIIFVIDSADMDNYEESKTEFFKLLKNDELKSSVVLIYANKQDKMEAKPIQELVNEYEFNTIKTHTWHIEPCSAKTGEGLMAGMKWLSDQLVYKKNTKFPNNPYMLNSNFYSNFLDYNNILQESGRTSVTSDSLNLSNIVKNDNNLNNSHHTEGDGINTTIGISSKGGVSKTPVVRPSISNIEILDK